MKRSLFFFALVLTAACSSPTPPPSAAYASHAPAARSSGPSSGVVRAALDSREAKRLAASLADEVGPRLAGSAGDAAAVAWAERTMRALALENVHREPVTVPVWRRIEDRAEIVGAPTTRKLDVSALGWSPSTPPGGIEGEVVRVATVDELAKLDAGAVRGKIVFVDASMKRTATGSGYGEAVGNRYRSQTVAASKGASAVVIRSVGTDVENPHTGSTNRNAPSAIPIGALANGSADELARAALSGPVKIKVVLASERLPDAPSANVVGEIKGSVKPDEVVLLAAHLDSWDTGRGAVDDGAGCGAVLDAIRLLAKEKPARTIRVVLFAAEENSRAGGTAYAAAHANELGKIVLTMEVDEGTGRVSGIGFIGDPAFAPSVRAISEPLANLGIGFAEGHGHAGADVEPMLSQGVPTLDLIQDATRYFDIHHTRGDTSEKLDGESLAQVTAVVAHMALRAADPNASFGRVPEALRPKD